MPPRARMFFATMTLALLFIPAVALYSELIKASDICAQRLPYVLTYAAVIGADLVVFLFVVTNRIAYRGERA